METAKYIGSIISRYILHQDYFHVYESLLGALGPEVFSIIQTEDQPDSASNTLAFCSRGQDVIPVPDIDFWLQQGYFDYKLSFTQHGVPWDQKVSRAFWRGSSTGVEGMDFDNFCQLPRFRLCAAAVDEPRLDDLLDAKFTRIVQAKNSEVREKIETFAQQRHVLAAPVDRHAFLKFKYQIDVDGNSNSWSLLPKMLMGSCIVKIQSEWQQWYYEKLEPWTHYVPVRKDLSDLHEKITWCVDHDKEARQIAEAGRSLATRLVFGTEMRITADALVTTAHSRSI